MTKLAILGSAFALFATLAVGPALADPAFTLTEHYNETGVADDTNPCVQAFGNAVVNGVMHATLNANGEHFTITETGTVVGDNGMGGALIAKYTFWLGGNFNANTGSFKVDLTLSATGTVDGVPFRFNLSDHFTQEGGTLKYNCHDGNGPQRNDY